MPPKVHLAPLTAHTCSTRSQDARPYTHHRLDLHLDRRHRHVPSLAPCQDQQETLFRRRLLDDGCHFLRNRKIIPHPRRSDLGKQQRQPPVPCNACLYATTDIPQGDWWKADHRQQVILQFIVSVFGTRISSSRSLTKASVYGFRSWCFSISTGI
jgi:hypothetical protein